jgi:hypothetical protein
MKKTILVLLSVFALTLAIVSCPGAGTSVTASIDVKEIKNAATAPTTIPETKVTISVVGDEIDMTKAASVAVTKFDFFKNVESEADFKGVAVDMEPAGSAAAPDLSKYVLKFSANELTENFEKEYTIVFPGKILKGGKDIEVKDKLKITVSGLPSASLGDATISSVNLAQLAANSKITVTLVNETFADALVATTDNSINAWFAYLPAGLNANIAAASDITADKKSVTITLTGTPSAVSQKPISLVIPATALSGNKAITVAKNENCKFNITSDTLGANVVSAKTFNFVVGTAIDDTGDATKFQIKLTGDVFDDAYFTHLNNVQNLVTNIDSFSGLSVSMVSGVNALGDTLTLYLSGTPSSAVAKTALTFVIPAAALKGSTSDITIDNTAATTNKVEVTVTAQGN